MGQLALAVATSDNTGTAQFVFPTGPPVGQVWTGVMFSPGAPPSAVFTATAGGQVLPPWSGAQPSPEVQIAGPGQITVLAIGLLALQQATISFYGTSDDTGKEPPSFPAIGGAQPPETILLYDPLHTVPALPATLTLSSGGSSRFAVGGMAGVACSFGASQPCRIACTWSTPPGPFLNAVGKSFSFGVPASFNGTNLFLPAQGSFLTMQAAMKNGGQLTSILTGVTGSSPPAWDFPSTISPSLIDVPGTTVTGSGGSLTTLATTTFSGPATFLVSTAAAPGWTVDLSWIDPGDLSTHLFAAISSQDVPSGAFRVMRNIELPTYPIQCVTTNNGAGNVPFFVSVVPSTFR